MSSIARKAGVRGIPIAVLKNVFVGVMALTFLVEFGFHEVQLFGLGDNVQFLTVLVATEVPLWFAQVLLWSRGEDIFQAFEPQLIETIEILRSLGITIQVVQPAIDALREHTSKLTPEQRDRIEAAIYAGASQALVKWNESLDRIDPAKVALVVKRRIEAKAKWHEEGAADAPQ